MADVGAVAEKMGRERMAKQVRMDARDRGRSGVLPHEDGEGHVGEAPGSFAISAKEEDFLFRILEKLRTNLAKVEIESFRCAAGQGDDAVSLPFGVPNEKPSLLEVDVRDVEAHALASADSGSVENLEKCAVALSSPGARGRCLH